jgi:hypothetical protein
MLPKKTISQWLRNKLSEKCEIPFTKVRCKIILIGEVDYLQIHLHTDLPMVTCEFRVSPYFLKQPCIETLQKFFADYFGDNPNFAKTKEFYKWQIWKQMKSTEAKD